MSKTTTSVSPVPGYRLVLDGRVSRAEAIDQAQAHFRRELAEVQKRLAAVEAGEARVSWWRDDAELPEPVGEV